MAISGGTKRILILGGTGEARALAGALVERGGIDVVTSLAGRTRDVAVLPGRVRVGGFGGAEKLADWLRAEAIDLVVDATHPFATTISAGAVLACTAAGVARLMLVRPPWTAGPGDRWIEAESFGEAASLLPRYGRRVFLTIGRQGFDAFASLEDMWFLVRVAEADGGPVPLPDCQIVAARGPFETAAEETLMREHRIDVLVCKASGGNATGGKLAAARALGLPVVMLRRPPPPPGPSAHSVAEALDMTVAMLDGCGTGDNTPSS